MSENSDHVRRWASQITSDTEAVLGLFATGVPADGRQFAREPGQKPNPDPIAARQPPARLR